MRAHKPAPVRRHDDDAPARRQDAPDLVAAARVGLSTVSSACTSSTRSIEASGSGIIIGSTSAEAEGPVAGQFTTPWLAGMKASVRSALGADRREIGRRVAETEHAQARQLAPEASDRAPDEPARRRAPSGLA